MYLRQKEQLVQEKIIRVKMAYLSENLCDLKYENQCDFYFLQF